MLGDQKIRITFCCTLFFCLFAHFYFPASRQAVVTGVVPSSPRFLPSTFIAHRVQHSHCSSIFHRMLLTHALALSAGQFEHEKKFQRIYTSMHSAGLELTKLTYTRLEDNLIRHRGDPYRGMTLNHTNFIIKNCHNFLINKLSLTFRGLGWSLGCDVSTVDGFNTIMKCFPYPTPAQPKLGTSQKHAIVATAIFWRSIVERNVDRQHVPLRLPRSPATTVAALLPPPGPQKQHDPPSLGMAPPLLPDPLFPPEYPSFLASTYFRT